MSEQRAKPLAPSRNAALSQAAFNVWFRSATEDECERMDRVHDLVNPQGLAVTMPWILEQALQHPQARDLLPATLLALLQPNAAGR